mmetsp:Transcript_19581/g.48760  ORF Transcript_19581/g.48760 Transcript_19581/m.48760 type:complete len:528 (-) Transcript_19581:55-1638(-)
MRYDLAFFLCCCKSFLGNAAADEEHFYGLLGLERDASADEIKKAYKKKSLQMHPDKLAQRGLTVTPEAQAKFQKMKEAYECLRDPHKRETYDAIGAKGMKWIDEPISMDPQELAQNFVNASILDRAKIFAIFVALVVVILYIPVIVCLHIDGVFGKDASWIMTLIPLWLGNALTLFYYSRILAMPTIPRPEEIPEDQWMDPFPMHVRIAAFVKFLLLATFEVFLALKLDDRVDWQWGVVLLPLLLWEAIRFYQAWTSKPIPELAQYFDLREKARQDLIMSGCRLVFIVILIVQFDTSVDLNWWLTFLPFWIAIFGVCVVNYQAFAKVKLAAVQKDPELFGVIPTTTGDEELGTNLTGNVDYGSVGNDGAATPEVASSNLTEEEKQKLKEEVVNSGSKLCTQCCSQGFILLILCLIVGKLQGASFSTLWLISPLLFAAGIILCCLGIAIFGVSEVPDMDASAFESETMVNPTTNYQAPTTTPTAEQPIVFVPAEPKIDEESGTAKDLSSTAQGSDESRHTATEIRELD